MAGTDSAVTVTFSGDVTLSFKINAINGSKIRGVIPPIKKIVCHCIFGKKMASPATKIAPTGKPQYMRLFNLPRFVSVASSPTTEIIVGIAAPRPKPVTKREIYKTSKLNSPFTINILCNSVVIIILSSKLNTFMVIYQFYFMALLANFVINNKL